MNISTIIIFGHFWPVSNEKVIVDPPERTDKELHHAYKNEQ